MQIDKQRKTLLRQLPGVDKLMEIIKKEPEWQEIPNSVILNAIRITLDKTRSRILEGNLQDIVQQIDSNKLLSQIKDRIKKANFPNLMMVINATGVVVHTNLGRSL